MIVFLDSVIVIYLTNDLQLKRFPDLTDSVLA